MRAYHSCLLSLNTVTLKLFSVEIYTSLIRSTILYTDNRIRCVVHPRALKLHLRVWFVTLNNFLVPILFSKSVVGRQIIFMSLWNLEEHVLEDILQVADRKCLAIACVISYSIYLYINTFHDSAAERELKGESFCSLLGPLLFTMARYRI